MILITNSAINYFSVFKSIIDVTIEREIRLMFSKTEVQNYSKILSEPRVDDFDSFYLISFEEKEIEDLPNAEINLAYYPEEWILDVQQISEDLLSWDTIYTDIAKCYPRTSTNKFPNI